MVKMQYKILGRTGLKVSRIGLGTAEIGFAYGIGSRPVPTAADAGYLLARAVEIGITYFDTASIYGLSEERIGKSGIARLEGIVVGTKCGSFLDQGERLVPVEMEKVIRAEVETSLVNLKLDTLPLLQLHGGTEEVIKRGDVIEILVKLKSEGKVKYLGISTRGENAALAAIHSGFFDTVQVAYSILDQRMAQQQVFLSASQRGIGIINRSVFLKGSLTSLAQQLPSGLELLQENSNKAKMIAQQLGMDLPTLALRFVLSNSAISSSLIGTNKIEHLRNAIGTLEQGPLAQDVLSELKNLAISDPKQVDPAKWPRL